MDDVHRPQDANLHIPIHRSLWKYLRFAVGRRKFEFKVLPFGITSATRVFTKVIAPVVEQVGRSYSLDRPAYLSDFLAKDQVKSFLTSRSKEAIAFIQQVVW